MPKKPPKEAPDPIDLHVGSRLRERRVGLRMSQGKLGEAIGVTFQQVQKYENGSNRIGASNLYKMAGALGVDVGFFFEGYTEPAPDTDPGQGLGDHPPAALRGDPMSSREAIELVYNYFRITDPDVQKSVFQLLKTLPLEIDEPS